MSECKKTPAILTYKKQTEVKSTGYVKLGSTDSKGDTMKWQSLSIGKKICYGFALVLVMLAIVAVWSVIGIGQIVGNAKVVIGGNKLKGEIIQREVDHLNWAKQVSALLTDDTVTALKVETDPHKCAFGKWYYSDERKKAEKQLPELTELLQSIEEPHNRLHASAVAIGEHFHQADLELGNILRDAKAAHLKWTGKVKDALIDPSVKTIDAESDPRKCSFGVWYYSDEVKKLRQQNPEFATLMASIEESHSALHQSLDTIRRLLRDGKRSQASSYYQKTTEPLAVDVLSKIDKVIAFHDEQVAGMKEANRIYADETQPSLEKVQVLLKKIDETVDTNVMTDEEMLMSALTTKTAIILLSTFALIIGSFLAVFVARGVIVALKRIITSLHSGAEQVASASNQISAGSQQLAEGASEQASSLEEITSSLEIMTTMTNQNAENAKSVNSMAEMTYQSARKGSETMGMMSEAMKKIKESSDETAKIIKTIDEIAFQTNLLALNAAVEAARAGEAGMGFAIVAEEVRKLARRSAEAAQTTSYLIEESKSNADNGVAVSGQIESILKEIVTDVEKMTHLVNEVSTASKEQSQGINEINKSLSLMDTVTQNAASNAEESASASEELSSQALELNEMVSELTVIVGGTACKKQEESPKLIQAASQKRQRLLSHIPGLLKS